MKRYYKHIYFPSKRCVTLSFSPEEKKLYLKVKNLSSKKIRYLLKSWTYEELQQKASLEYRTVTNYIKSQLKKMFLACFFFLFFVSFKYIFAQDGTTKITLDMSPDIKIIEISAEVVEINNNQARQLGVQWVDSVQIGELLLPNYTKGPLGQLEPTQPNMLPVRPPSIFEAGEVARWSPYVADIKFLLEKGAAKIVSSPKVTVNSGTAAKFHVGGSIPIAVGGNVGGTVEFKDYGMLIECIPTALDKNKIHNQIKVEVSRLDWANKVGAYPAIVTRAATTCVTVSNGDTITIAGLQEAIEDKRRTGIPFLMDIPILGYLFSYTKTVIVKNSVLILITPRVISK